MTHLTFDEISELADRKAESRDVNRAEGSAEHHLVDCAECRETLRKVRDLVQSARMLPRDVEPPPEIWTSLRTRVGAAPPRATARWRSGWVAIAATIIIVVGAALLVPGRPGPGKGKAKAIAPVAVTDASMHLAIEQNYAGTVAELRRALELQRATLSPATIRVLERSLATIDTAIAEARAALASDPANQALISILSANYEHKVELLKRATELAPKS